eukprot:gnl/TRDRNA2_/TRDRNA2_162632_c0_seq2.p1 gnl/TRDRNA2_/TRDRNA2_162632_c0~~gnl/TRDRNA2_/TRDRNA2_162632_c0_seq2.p1  ORF type:complete len:141 (+),score=6.80 gnl/TRDRNA2_/TRDRNA2_162632_c0_seq2:82-504(+)
MDAESLGIVALIVLVTIMSCTWACHKWNEYETENWDALHGHKWGGMMTGRGVKKHDVQPTAELLTPAQPAQAVQQSMKYPAALPTSALPMTHSQVSPRSPRLMHASAVSRYVSSPTPVSYVVSPVCAVPQSYVAVPVLRH